MTKVQDSIDDREIALDRVGVTEVTFPLKAPVRGGGTQDVRADVAVTVGLEQRSRGVHMSRLLEVLHEWEGVLEPEGIEVLLQRLRTNLEAPTAQAEFGFTYFTSREAPVSGAESRMACEVLLEAELAEDFDLVLTVEAPALSVCPCSIEATGGPAHSQRGYVAVSVRFDGIVHVEDLLEMIDDSGSSPVYALLKAEDERAILEAAHRNPVFVEDLARNVAERLDSDVRVYWYRVEAENLESVHSHNAYACVERSRDTEA